ncbi:hypothetical protein KFE25_013199 [Diacronema lutheri]|uniref:Uncharacterized protein n=2 Tax=Diacronema lutheri TaxID=2081491 RepID=A0A8J5XGT2_DIALT|nr:hypothetical protein KFE25_013199 [Diacronema lutheri]
MSDKAALRGRWGATNHDFDFRKYNTFAEQIAKEQDAQFKASARLQKHSADGTDPFSHAYNAAGTAAPVAPVTAIDWGKPSVKPRPLPISGVPRPRFHTRGGDGARRRWGSEPEPQTSTEIGSWYGNRSMFADVDSDGRLDGAEAAAGGRAALRASGLSPAASQDAHDDALFRSINGRRDKWGEDMYSVVNLADAGYML